MWNQTYQSNSCEIKEIVESILYFKIQICFCFLKAIGPVQNSNCSSHAARWASILNQVFHCCINNPFSSDLFVFFCRSSAGWLTLSPFNLPIEHFGNYRNRYFIQIHCCLKNQFASKMFLFWFICIFLQNDWRCNRSFYLSTNILKIIQKCSCGAGSDACQRMVLRICERCRNVPVFFQRDAFLIFAPLLLCSNLFFFWQVEHSGSLWRVCGLCACCGLW